MGFGIVLMIVGAILTFAVRRDSSVVDLQTVGVIFMIAGAALIYLSRRGSTQVHETQTVDDLTDPKRPVHTMHETIHTDDGAVVHEPLPDDETKEHEPVPDD